MISIGRRRRRRRSSRFLLPRRTCRRPSSPPPPRVLLSAAALDLFSSSSLAAVAGASLALLLLLLSFPIDRVSSFVQQQQQQRQQQRHIRRRHYSSSSSPPPLVALRAGASTYTLSGLSAGIIGAGPSGLLLAHKLLQGGASRVVVYEKRPPPSATLSEDGRAYALGLGRRGRTAIKSVDDDLWRAVRTQGFDTQRFDLYPPSFLPKIRLRNDGDGGQSEPSLLLFQSGLCLALGSELVERYDSDRLELLFDTQVDDLKLGDATTTVTASDVKSKTRRDKFDFVAGCDGVNSIVRMRLDEASPLFTSASNTLPGAFKTVRLNNLPPLVDDPTAVALIFPKKGAATAFYEPTANGTCCILFGGSGGGDPLLSGTASVDELAEIIVERFPLLEGVHVEAAEQLASLKKTSTAKSVVCNTFHHPKYCTALVGDSAHATGGVSGQGVNSALVDSKVLAEALCQHYDSDNKSSSVRAALLTYSQLAVPEGKALYDLSFGPKSRSVRKRLGYLFKSTADTLFQGKFGIGELTLQTKMTTSLQSFASIRKALDPYYDDEFPDQAYWNQTLADLDERMLAEKM